MTRRFSTVTCEWWEEMRPGVCRNRGSLKDGGIWMGSVTRWVAGSCSFDQRIATANWLLMGVVPIWGQVKNQKGKCKMQRSPEHWWCLGFERVMNLGLLSMLQSPALQLFPAPLCPHYEAYRDYEVRWNKQPEIAPHSSLKTLIRSTRTFCMYTCKELITHLPCQTTNPNCYFSL